MSLRGGESLFIVFIILFILICLNSNTIYGFEQYGYEAGIIEDKLRMDHTSPGIRCGERREMGLHEAVFIETPNYSHGKKYPNSITCKWSFHLKGCTLAITCPNFDLNKFLCFDYLDVSDGKGRFKRFCGNQGPQGVHMEDKVNIVFKSSPSFSSSGFRCYAICVSEGPASHASTELMLPSIPVTSVGLCACGKRAKREVRRSGGMGGELLPWVAKVLRKKDYKLLCAATLVSNQYLVTAAHCFSPPDADSPEEIIVLLNEKPKEAGLLKLNSKNRKVSEIRRYFEHGIKYELDADVALIKLEETIDFQRHYDIIPICLPKGEDASKHFVGSSAYLSTWEWDVDWHDQHLHTSRSIVVQNENCTKTTHPNNFRREHSQTAVPRMNTLCTKSLSRTCQSVSGSPLMTVERRGGFGKFTLIGIGTWGSTCALRSGVDTHTFTRVTEILPWIISNTQDSSFCQS